MTNEDNNGNEEVIVATQGDDASTEDVVAVEAVEAPKKKRTRKKRTTKKRKATATKEAEKAPAAPTMKNEPYKKESGPDSYAEGQHYIVNRLTHISGAWVPAGTVYTVTSTANSGKRATLEKVRGSGPASISLGLDRSFVFRA